LTRNSKNTRTTLQVIVDAPVRARPLDSDGLFVYNVFMRISRRSYRFSICRAKGSLVVLTVSALLFGCGGDDTPNSPNENGGPPVITVDTIPPADVRGMVAAQVSAFWVTLHWLAPGDDGWTGTAAEYDIRYSTSPITEQNWAAAGQVADEPIPNTGGQLQTHRVTGLEPLTQYYFAIKTSDEVPNESGISNTATGTTLQEYVPPWPVDDLMADAVDDTTFLLTWTATGNNWDQGTASEYDIRYLTTTITDANWESAEPVTGEPPPKTSGEPESLLVSGLSPDINYSFAMKVADAVPNWSALSNSSFALAYNSYVLIYPEVVHEGNDLTILYRAEQNSYVRINLFYGQMSLDCSRPYLTLLSRVYEQAGTYRLTFDCINPNTQDYLSHAAYVIVVCIDNEIRGTDRFSFTD
jgi:hypothetical protein